MLINIKNLHHLIFVNKHLVFSGDLVSDKIESYVILDYNANIKNFKTSQKVPQITVIYTCVKLTQSNHVVDMHGLHEESMRRRRKWAKTVFRN